MVRNLKLPLLWFIENFKITMSTTYFNIIIAILPTLCTGVFPVFLLAQSDYCPDQP